MSAKRARGSEEPRLCRVAGRKVWYVYHKARRFSTRATSRAEAEAFLADFRAALDRPQPGTTISLSEILDRYLADRRDAQIPGLDRLEWAHKALKRFWGERPPECITDAECRLYVRQRAVEHSGPHYKTASASTARTELQALNAALQWACKKEFISKAPRIVLPQRPPPRERWLTREEADRLIASCGAHHIRVFVEIALRTGARSGAIKSLTWDRVDFGQRLIDFREPGRIQTRKKRVQVHIVDILLPVLQEAYEMRTTQWVIEYAGGRVGSIKHAFARACIKAGLKGVTPHTLRHTAGSWMVQQGVPLTDVAAVLGNSVQVVEDTYAHLAPDHLRRALKALG